MKNWEVGGHWWLPGREGNKVPGTLAFDPKSGGTLTLIGALLEVEEVATAEATGDGGFSIEIGEDEIEAAGTYQRIYGRADNRDFTLEEGQESHRSGGMLWMSTSRQVVHVNRIFEGAHLPEGGAPSGNGLIVTLDGLTAWTGRTGITGKVLVSSSEEFPPQYTVQGSRLPIDRVEVEAGGQLSLRHYLNSDGEAGIRGLRESFDLKVNYPDPTDAESLVDIASDLQDLVSLGTGRSAAFGKIAVLHPDVQRNLGNSTERTPIHLYAAWTAQKTTGNKPLTGHDLFFTLEDLGGLEAVARWLRTAGKHRQSLSRVMATRYDRTKHVADRYLDCIASLERLNRDEAGDSNQTVSLERRLRRCTNLAGAPITRLIPDVEAWIKVLKSDRDNVAHHYGRRLRQHTAEQYYLAESAFWLFVCCMLRLSEAPDAVFDRIVEHEQFQFLRRRLERFVPTAPAM